MKSLNIKPTLVVSLDVSKDECIKRVNKRRIDPVTGSLYNLEITHLLPKSEETKERLISMKQDATDIYHKRF
jgi:thymidylate kinase